MNDKTTEMAVIPIRKLYTLATTILELFEIDLLEDAYKAGLLDRFTVTQKHLDDNKFWDWTDKPRIGEEVYWLGAPRHLEYRLKEKWKDAWKEFINYGTTIKEREAKDEDR